MTLNKKQVQQNRERIRKLLLSTKREGIEKLVDWLDTTDYYTAPASTRLDYHGCHEGGLAEHSLHVYEMLEAKAKCYDLGVQPEEMTIAALLHDLCKVDIYTPNHLKSGQLSETKPYVIKENFPFGHGEKSAYIANQHVRLTPTEALLIRWHMGNFDNEWEVYREKVAAVCPAIYAFQYADDEASKYLDMRVVKGKGPRDDK